jgi:hypothetical protein
VLDLARGVPPATSRIDLVTELVVRESTGPAPQPTGPEPAEPELTGPSPDPT